MTAPLEIPLQGSCRLGVDIGGTFTDGILIDERSGLVVSEKVLTTPADPSEGFLEIVLRLLRRTEASPDAVGSIIHATTVATNAVIEKRGARAALLVTAGFRDILEIARQIRHELYNLQTDKPVPLIPRRYCFEIDERLDYRGAVLRELDVRSVEVAALKIGEADIASVAICFLHSYRNGAHEEKAAEIISRMHPHITISLSSDVAPEIREYWRASTTVVNAYIAPIVSKYVERVEERLVASRVTAPLYFMQSNGGIASVSSAKRNPVYLIESGPAAGVAVSAHFCNIIGSENAVAFDMGGTTAKMGLITDGKSSVSAEFEVGGEWSGSPLVRGSGYPVLGSVVDLVEVGAGGGSIATVDSGGVLKVGPASAGAVPGPACYGRGGTEPTVTDANLVLGRLDPNYFAGGEIGLDAEAALEAVRRFCSEPLGLDPLEAAMGIVDIANIRMVQAMRLVSVQRGHDPRSFSLVATGGAGPLHANALAIELGIPLVVIPPSPGVASAFGMLVSDLRWDMRTTVLEPLEQALLQDLEEKYAALEAHVTELLESEVSLRGQVSMERFAEMRYIGQSWKLRVLPPSGPLRDEMKDDFKERFDSLHHQAYGYSVRSEPVEIANIGLTAIGAIARPQLENASAGRPSTKPPRTVRPIYFRETDGTVMCDVVDRYALSNNDVVDGPAVIEEADSTTIVYPGYSAQVGTHGTLLIRSQGSRTP